MKLTEIGEFAVIAAIKEMAAAGPRVVKGIGDDAAVIKPSPGMVSLVTADLLVEGVHFNLDFIDPYRLGKKAVAVNLSDMAACGATPTAFLVSLAAPVKTEMAFVRSLYQGMLEQAQEFKMPLAGGDTSRGERLLIAITLIGEAEETKVIYRAGAKKGDHVFVTGTLGDAAVGLKQLKQGKREGKLVQRHLVPVPRVKEGEAIAGQGLATAMIDISDGLLADLGHICEASTVGANVQLSRLPLSEEYQREIAQYNADTYLLAMIGGEDYELLFTAPKERTPATQKLAQEFGIPITMIGEITDASQGVKIFKEDGKVYPMKEQGYDHFKKGG
jgi:thiamine-monophosphate kinase